MVWGVRRSPLRTRVVTDRPWQWAACTFFLMFIALALAELGSSAPTSGGLYYWTWTLATPRWRKVLSWVVGCETSVPAQSRYI